MSHATRRKGVKTETADLPEIGADDVGAVTAATGVGAGATGAFVLVPVSLPLSFEGAEVEVTRAGAEATGFDPVWGDTSTGADDEVEVGVGAWVPLLVIISASNVVLGVGATVGANVMFSPVGVGATVAFFVLEGDFVLGDLTGDLLVGFLPEVSPENIP